MGWFLFAAAGMVRACNCCGLRFSTSRMWLADFLLRKKLYNDLSLSHAGARDPARPTRPAAVSRRMKLDCRGLFTFILFEVKKIKFIRRQVTPAIDRVPPQPNNQLTGPISFSLYKIFYLTHISSVLRTDCTTVFYSTSRTKLDPTYICLDDFL